MCVSRKGKADLLAAWCSGWLMMYALLYLPAAIGIEAGWTLDFTVKIWLALMTPLAAAGIFRFTGFVKEGEIRAGNLFRSLTVFDWIALLLVLFHAFITFRGMYVDDDDINYVGAAATAVYTNTVLKYDPAVGNLIKNFHYIEVRKLVTAPLFVYYAAVSRMFHIQTAALAHTYLPPVFTCLFYGIFYTLGKRLFPKNRSYRGIFLILVFLIHMSSWYSIYTAGTFLMIRSWQGKAQIVGAVLPMLLVIFLDQDTGGRMPPSGIWLLVITMAAACLMSSMGAVLASGMVVMAAFIRAVQKRSSRILLSCLPALLLPVVSAVMYFRL